MSAPESIHLGILERLKADGMENPRIDSFSAVMLAMKMIRDRDEQIAALTANGRG